MALQVICKSFNADPVFAFALTQPLAWFNHPFREQIVFSMKAFLLASMLLLLWAISCRKEMESSGLTIIAGSVCGWCAGEDSVIITENLLNYRFMSPCDHRAYSKLSYLNRKDWYELTSKIDFEVFSGIYLNTCNVCADGCDQWITIRKGTYAHTIRFGSQDSVAIQSIQPLVNQLDSLRRSYRNRVE